MIGIALTFLFAQTLNASVQGVIVAADSGKGIPNAQVELLRTDGAAPQSYPATTAADGAFRILNVRPGEYRVSATRNGYLPGEYGQRRPGTPATPITLGPGQAVQDLRIAITPAGLISGRISDRDGTPLAAATVQALKPGYQDGRRILQLAQSTVTNDLGEYRLFGLAPGQYYVSATPFGGSLISSVTVNPVRSMLAATTYLPVYFPGVTDLKSATAIDLTAAPDHTGTDMIAPPERMYHARGAIAADQGNIKVAPLSVTPGTTVLNASAGPNGKFDIGGLVPGTYLLQAVAPDSEGRTVLEIRDADVDNVSIPFITPFRIPGRLTFDDRPPSDNDPDAERVFFQLSSDPKLDGLEPVTYNPFPNGSFALLIMPGDYRITSLRFNGHPNAYLKAVRIGNLDVLNEGLHLRGPMEGVIEVVVGTKPGVLSGTAAANATVVLIPNAGRRRWPDTALTAKTDALGRFQIQNIPPGDYTVFAWDDLEPNAWQDPAFMRAYEGRGTLIHVGEGSRQSAELRVLR